METKVIAFAGPKQSGKSSSSNYLHGLFLKLAGRVKSFRLDNNGKLIVNKVNLVDGQEGEGILDIDRRDELFAEYANKSIWPLIKSYSYADELKRIAVVVFGLNPEYVNGTNEQKNLPTNFTWNDFWFALSNETKKDKKLVKDQKMTHREFLQVFGTDICRHIYPDCWIKPVQYQIEQDKPMIAVIVDCRFPNEVRGAQEIGGKVVHLKRRNSDDSHSSELELEKMQDSEFSATIDNSDMTIDDKNENIKNLLIDWAWINKNEIE